MAKQEIKQRAEEYAKKHEKILNYHYDEPETDFKDKKNAYIAGAHSRDEEVEILQNQIKELSERLKMNKDVEASEYISGVHKLQPIPITPEILEKNGLWEKDPDRSPNCLIAESNTTQFNDTDGKPHSWIGIQDISPIECKRWYIKIWGKGNLSVSGYIGYVHELQNAMRLCGIDKEIKLC